MGDLQGERAKLFEKSFRPLPLHPLTHFKNFWKKEGKSLTHFKNFWKKEGHSLTHFKNFWKKKGNPSLTSKTSKKEGKSLTHFKNFRKKVSVFTPFKKRKGE